MTAADLARQAVHALDAGAELPDASPVRNVIRTLLDQAASGAIPAEPMEALAAVIVDTFDEERPQEPGMYLDRHGQLWHVEPPSSALRDPADLLFQAVPPRGRSEVYPWDGVADGAPFQRLLTAEQWEESEERSDLAPMRTVPDDGATRLVTWPDHDRRWDVRGCMRCGCGPSDLDNTPCQTLEGPAS